MRAILQMILLTVGATAFAQSPDPVTALKDGKATVDVRLRYENVDDQATAKTADALTSKLMLSYKSGEWKGLSTFLQFEDVAALATPLRYFVPQTGVGDPTRAGVADPPGNRVNQFYLNWKSLKVGRQAVDLDDQRFIGTVGWRQFGQAYTGASYANDTWIPRTDFMVGHFTQVATVFGTTKDVRMDLAHARVALWKGARITVFRYAVQEVLTPATSLAHTGARLDGDTLGFLYEASYASQRAFKDATPAGTKDASYRLAGVGYAFTPTHKIMLIQEELEPGFKTPYATLHAWNGWADRFLVTPSGGLRDRFLRYRGKLGAWSLEAAYHAFAAQIDGTAFGREADVSVEYQAAAWAKVMIKAARYQADSATPTLGGPNRDLNKFWIQTALHF